MHAEDRLWFRLVCRNWATAGAGVAPAAGEKPLPPGKVTRTRGPDAAASVARAEMVLGVLEGSARERFKRHLCAFSAEGGCLEVLQWARAQGLPMDATTCAGAASGGHLEVLKWARAQGCTWDDRTTTAAAENGHLEVLQWARSKKKASSGQSRAGKCPWKSGGKGLNLAAKNGHLAVLKWARAKGFKMTTHTCAAAAANGHLAVLQWLRAVGCPWDVRTCAYAAKNGHLAVLQWARAKGAP